MYIYSYKQNICCLYTHVYILHFIYIYAYMLYKYILYVYIIFIITKTRIIYDYTYNYIY